MGWINFEYLYTCIFKNIFFLELCNILPGQNCIKKGGRVFRDYLLIIICCRAYFFRCFVTRIVFFSVLYTFISWILCAHISAYRYVQVIYFQYLNEDRLFHFQNPSPKKIYQMVTPYCKLQYYNLFLLSGYCVHVYCHLFVDHCK